MKIKVGVSKRHVHLTKETFVKLFGSENQEIRNYLNQPGEFASKHTVDLKWNDKILERTRVLGPFRSYDQVEISRSEAEFFGITTKVAKSGDLSGSHPIILIGPAGEVEIPEGLIIASRHIHMDEETAHKNNFKDDEEVLIYQDNQKLFTAAIKINNPSYLEMHIDVDESKEFNLNQDDEVEIKKCGSSEI